ncbi:hypothetical protein EG68_09835 [Paragonimus skrjabini miyazakii]|uniref:Uncharacterized protein n=1 Tax=Paragonimus skrjabini miyazakii TaxID=59628 RepID=A0A8S9Y8D8_9TREM|nr:hypothetical protein EG68_09835 [Paragonimus skrjabini miyazakii]
MTRKGSSVHRRRNFVQGCPSLKKDPKQRPKYRSLMNSEFFCIHNVEPLNVLEWLQNLPLKHLHQPKESGPEIKQTLMPPVGVSSSSADSPNSTSTFSPDMDRAFRRVSLDESLTVRPVEFNNGHKVSGLDVVLVAAPTVSKCAVNETRSRLVCPSPIPSPSFAREQSRCQQSVDCRSGTKQLTTPCESSTHLAVRATIDQTRLLIAQSQDPCSQASSGYGSTGSDGFSGNSRPSSATQLADIHAINLDFPKTDWVAVGCSGQDITGNSNLSALDAHRGSADLPDTSVPSTNANVRQVCKTEPNDRLQVPTNNSVAPLIQMFEPDYHRFGFGQSPKSSVLTENRTIRSFTPPITAIKGSRTAQLDFADRRDARPARSSTSQSRSSSVGAHLHRTPAQRWPVRPNIGSKCSATRTRPAESLTCQSVASSGCHVPELCDPSAKSLLERAPQQYHHQYFHYYHQRPPVHSSGHPQTVTPPLSQQASAELFHSKPAAPYSPSTWSSNSTRLAQRLHTHPLPRQTNTCSMDPRTQHIKQPRSLSALPPHASVSPYLHTSPISSNLLEHLSPSSRPPCVPSASGKASCTVRPNHIARSSSRSSSDRFAVSRSRDRPSFETDL